jgi:uncharacterized protein (DUF488 family)
MSKILTIGFTEKTAEHFFNLLKKADVKVLFDVRLNKSSQLSAFAKRDDLKFFLKNLCAIEYVELPELAPEAGMLKDYRNKVIDWTQYESLYTNLLAKRSVEKCLDASILEQGCLLCSEHKPHYCHRRVAVEYLNTCWGNKFVIQHLL